MRPAAIHTERDTEGLQQAIRGLFEESFQRAAIDASALGRDPESKARALEDLDQRELSPGYYTRAVYLIGLKQTIELGVAITDAELTATDVAGLQCVARAKASFERDHPSCGNCGKRQDNAYANKCKGCKVQFLRGDA